MMNDLEFEAWHRRLNLSDEAISEIQKIRSSEPSRLTDARKKSITGRFPSQKMGRTIQFRSHQNELARIYQLESDDDVLEYWDQPPAIYLDYPSKAGRRMYQPYSPDFFVIRTSNAEWEDCKSEMELLSLAKKSPNRWQHEEGNWRHLPGEDYAKRLGLSYRVQLVK